MLARRNFCFALLCVAVQLCCVFSTSPPGPFIPSFTSSNRVLSPSFKSVIDILCNATKLDSEMSRDACYGCFSRVSSYSQSKKSLEILKTCATTYLDKTEFKPCSDILVDTTYGGVNDTNSTVFCDFEKCARKVDKQTLISQCTKEVKARDEDNTDADIFLKTTACVLANIRCRELNNMQEMYIDPNRGYALMITDNYDMTVTPVYGGGMGLTCGNNHPGMVSMTKQASWPSATCS